MVDKKILKVIEDLKIARKEKGISYQEIANRTQANGEPVSLSTIKLVFSEKTKHNHNYENVILPIANALSPSDENDIDVKLLQARLELKDEMLREKCRTIEEQKERIAYKDQQHKEREQFLIEQIDFYKEQIKAKDEQIHFRDKQIKRYEENIDRKDAELRRLYTERE